MNDHRFVFAGETLYARPSGALWWPRKAALAVSDLHLGKPERMARRGGAILPPYADAETLARLQGELTSTGATTVISLGDGFDDDGAAANLSPESACTLRAMMADRSWIWISGNHDPAPPPWGGESTAELRLDGLTFRHIAEPGATGELSGHYHPKARLHLGGTRLSRPCFLIDRDRVILPAFGAYTGGLTCADPALTSLMADDALAVLTGQTARPVPMPRQAPAPQLAPAPPRRFG